MIEQLVATAIRHGVYYYPVLWAGICLDCIASILYDMRETIFTSFIFPLFPATGVTNALNVNEFLSINGPMTVCSFALIMAGFFLYIAKTGQEENREPERS